MEQEDVDNIHQWFDIQLEEENKNQVVRPIINIQNRDEWFSNVNNNRGNNSYNRNDVRYINNNRRSKSTEKENNEATVLVIPIVIQLQNSNLQQSMMRRRIHPEPTNNQSMLC